MDYRKMNKEAWEEAFENRKENWGEDNYAKLKEECLPFLHPDIVKEVENIDFTGKSVAQFCCNNGRELLSLMQLGPASGTGFDFAKNIIQQARDTANKAGIACDFVACDILEMDQKYYNQFDFIFFTIGAITWFRDLNELFDITIKCLKPSGLLLIHDFHPFMNMLPLPSDDEFDSNNLNKITFKYMRDQPWIDNCGMNYMTPEYESKTFTSYAHTTSQIINVLIQSGLVLQKFDEFDYDVGVSEVYDGLGYPLSFVLLAQKP